MGFQPPTDIPYVPLALEYYADDFTQRHNTIGHITLRPVNLPTALRELLCQVHTMAVYADGTMQKIKTKKSGVAAHSFC